MFMIDYFNHDRRIISNVSPKMHNSNWYYLKFIEQISVAAGNSVQDTG